MTDKHYILTYELSDDYLDRRGGYRAEHLGLAKLYAEDGRLVLGGALVDPADKAVLVFKGPDDSAARAFVEADPYMANGLVKSWSIREWMTVVGGDAACPVIV
ncbi:MAG: YciI-like protein [Pseudomonadota bacterium]